ncbi:MAG: ISH3 family transposase ISMbu7 [Chroococcidiopsis cubana SAG 39.79]|uniref:ISH3 family transposase n=2 Tax=Chroococcidiopsis TaxID=54298 RepID=A0AB37UHK1_9CYAN|nr:transposase [Chroococcidiopsis cubana]MDZ4876756.1 ISH3 family transposase ISMbu7 [Chroococcidiopsis cubana SAG 39.79]RUT10599.1 ISH3 family transposase [Chroococcidiopsis cubana SAG 39.79]
MNKLSQIALTDEETLTVAVDCLAKHIPLDAKEPCDPKTLFQILLRAAATHDTIENTAKQLKQVTTSNNIRYHLGKINNFIDLEQQLNSSLKSQIPKGLSKKKQSLAIDFNLIPYYGKPSESEAPFIYRSQAKLGTCSFYAYATLYVIKKGKRVTLAIRGVRWLDTKVAIITYLLAELSLLKIRVKKLYLDREFFSIAVIRWLQALHIPLILPAIIRGKKGGIKQFLQGRKSYQATYVMSKTKEESVTLDLQIICKYRKGKRKKRGLEYFVYVVHQLNISLAYLHQDYRKRFGIESSYRLKNVCRIRTTTKKPTLRLLFVGIAFLLVSKRRTINL